MNSSLSQRGLTASQSVLRIDFKIYFEALNNLYHQHDNPTGTFPLNVAENKLSWGMLRNHIEKLASENHIPNWVANYTNSTGSPTFRKVVAEFLEKFLTHCPIDPDQLALSAGSTSVIDLTSWVLGEPGDVAVFPAPCYPVYKQDIQNKSGLERYDLITHHEISELKSGPPLTINHLESALKEITASGKRFRILVITNPDNPTGGMYELEKLRKIADWCVDHQIHMIVNEIYGLSLIDTKHPQLIDDYEKHMSFQSFATIMQEQQNDFLHLWYALSKDFGASGFRVGLVYSQNKTFLEAYHNLNAPSMVSNYTQWIFELILADHAFLQAYIQSNQQLLTESYLKVVSQLRINQIPYAPAYGSLFVWLDLSEFLTKNTQKAESELWLELYNQTGILLTPGDGFGHSKRGQFRLVYSCVPKNDLEVAMNRLTSFIESKRS